MPRIRTIKPEFWSSPDVAQASAVARLAYIAMWNWADDYGRGTFNLKELEGFIFPNDEVSLLSEGRSATFRDVVKEVVTVFQLVIYEVDRRTYFQIPSWDEHQRTERKAKSKFPAPKDGFDVSGQWIYVDVEIVEELPAHSEGTSDVSEGSSGIGTGEQGNREQGKKKTCSNRNAYPAKFEEWYELYPRHVGKADALKAWKVATKKITPQDLNAATVMWARAYEASGNDPSYIPYPATWLRRGGWDDEPPVPSRAPALRKQTDLDSYLAENGHKAFEDEPPF